MSNCHAAQTFTFEIPVVPGRTPCLAGLVLADEAVHRGVPWRMSTCPTDKWGRINDEGGVGRDCVGPRIARELAKGLGRGAKP